MRPEVDPAASTSRRASTKKAPRGASDHADGKRGHRVLIREDENQNLVSLSELGFVKNCEPRPDCLGRRCQFVVKPGRKKFEAAQLRLLGANEQKAGKNASCGESKSEKSSKTSGCPNQQSEGINVAVEETEKGDWEQVVRPRARTRLASSTKPAQACSEVETFPVSYKFLGKVASFNKKTQSGTIKSSQVEMVNLKFEYEAVHESLRSAGQQLKGSRVFFKLSSLTSTSPKVWAVTYASDAMTPQRINGYVTAWDGRIGFVATQSQVQALLFRSHIRTGDPDAVKIGTKVNFSLVLTSCLELEAREAICNTGKKMPVPSQSSRRNVQSSANTQVNSRLTSPRQCSAVGPRLSAATGSGEPWMEAARWTCQAASAAAQDKDLPKISASVLKNFLSSDVRGQQPHHFWPPLPTVSQRLSPKPLISAIAQPTLAAKSMQASGSTTIAATTPVRRRAGITPLLTPSPPPVEMQSPPPTKVIQAKEKSTRGLVAPTFKNITDNSPAVDSELAGRLAVAGEEELGQVFIQLKPQFAILLADKQGCDVLNSLIRRVAKLALSKLETSITRIIVGQFNEIFPSKGGCRIFHTGLKLFSERNREMLGEKILELDCGDLMKFLVYGTGAFKQALGVLDDQSILLIAETVAGKFGQLACHVKYYMAVKELITRASHSAEAMEIIEEELEELYRDLAFNRFGRFVLCGILESCAPSVKTKVVETVLENMEELSCHEFGSGVVVAAVRHGSDFELEALVKKVCEVKARETETIAVQLAKHEHGHKVIMSMIEVSGGRQFNLDLKAALLFKQEMLFASEYGSRVINQTKMY